MCLRMFCWSVNISAYKLDVSVFGPIPLHLPTPVYTYFAFDYILSKAYTTHSIGRNFIQPPWLRIFSAYANQDSPKKTQTELFLCSAYHEFEKSKFECKDDINDNN